MPSWPRQWITLNFNKKKKVWMEEVQRQQNKDTKSDVIILWYQRTVIREIGVYCRLSRQFRVLDPPLWKTPRVLQFSPPYDQVSFYFYFYAINLILYGIIPFFKRLTIGYGVTLHFHHKQSLIEKLKHYLKKSSLWLNFPCELCQGKLKLDEINKLTNMPV